MHQKLKIHTVHNYCLVYQTKGSYCSHIKYKHQNIVFHRGHYQYTELFPPVIDKEKILVAQYIGYFQGVFLFHKDIDNLDLQLLIT